MAVLTHWTKVIPATAGAVLVGAWTNPAHAFFPSYLPDIVNPPVVTVPLPPPPTVNVPNEVPPTPLPPVSPPPFVPPPPPAISPPPPVPNVPTTVPPCGCNPPSQVPEPTTLVTGLIGLGVAGAVSRARRRFGGNR